MTRIIGHSTREDKSNFIFLIAIVVVLIVLAGIALTWFGARQEKPKEAKVTTTTRKPFTRRPGEVFEVTVTEKVTCHRVEGGQPKSVSNEFSPGELVYYFTRVKVSTIPIKLKHVWINQRGEARTIIELPIRHEQAYTWSRITLPPASSGKWKIRVMVGEKVVGESNFKVK